MMQYLLIFLFAISSLSCLFEFDRALAYQKKLQWKESLVLLENLLVSDPTNFLYVYHAGLAQYKMKNFTEALHYFSLGATFKQVSDEHMIKTLYNQANAHFKLSQFQEAIDGYLKVLAIDPNNEYALYNKKKAEEKLKEEQQNKQQEQQSNDQESMKNNDDASSDDQQSEDGNKKKESSSQDLQDDNDKKQSGNDKKNKRKNSKEGSHDRNSSEQNGQSQSNNEARDSQDKQKDQFEKGNNEMKNDQSEERNPDKIDDQRNQQNDNHFNKSQKDTAQGGKEKSSHNKDALQKSKKVASDLFDQENQERLKKLEALEQGELQANEKDAFELLKKQDMRDQAENKELMKALISNRSQGSLQSGW